MPYVPPWLDVRPSDFAKAQQEGSRLGLEQSGQNLEAAKAAASMAMQQQDAQQQMQVERERAAAQQQEQQARIRLLTEQAARKFQAQQAYQSALASGMDPVQAMMTHGPAMGESMTGLGTMSAAKTREKMASMPPQFVNDPNNPKTTLGVTYGGQFHPVRQPAKLGTGMDDKAHQKAVDYNIGILKLVDKQIAGNASGIKLGSAGSADNARALNAQRRTAEAALKRLGVSTDGTPLEKQSSSDSGPSQSDIDFLTSNPGKAALFDKKFGQGMADAILNQSLDTPQDMGE